MQQTLSNEDYLSTLTKLGDKSIDLVLTSLPVYHVSKGRRGWRSVHDYTERTIKLFWELDRVLKPCRVVVGSFQEPGDSPSFIYSVIGALLMSTGFMVADTIVSKISTMQAVSSNRLNRVLNHTYVFCRKEEFTNFEAAGEQENFFDITPVEFNEKLLRIYAKEGDTIYDPFMGTGLTALAAKNNGMGFIGSETNTAQFEISLKRLEAAEQSVREIQRQHEAFESMLDLD
jgi:DNA modification methylase